MHNNGIKKLLAPGNSVAGDIDADPSAPDQRNYSEYANTGANPNLPKAFSSSKCDDQCYQI